MLNDTSLQVIGYRQIYNSLAEVTKDWLRNSPIDREMLNLFRTSLKSYGTTAWPNVFN